MILFVRALVFVLFCMAVAPSQQKNIQVDHNNGIDASCIMSDNIIPCKTLRAAVPRNCKRS